MIPSGGPREHARASRESIIYDALSGMSDDFTVVHSCSLVSTSGGNLREREADFVVFHPKLGILCIEAKAGQVSYSGGEWRYASGLPMRHGGPYLQAERIKWSIRDRFDDLGLTDIKSKVKYLHAVWFHDLSIMSLRQICLPPEASIDLTLTREDLLDPEKRIREIFAINVANATTDLTEVQADKLVSRVLCPEFSIAPTPRLKYDIAGIEFARLLDSQARVLNFLEDQRVAVINGAAGTGKTLIAVERARRAAAHNERVLFLCFNSLLKDNLVERCSDEPLISVKTIAGYACSVCRTSEPDYNQLAEQLIETIGTKAFPYKHVVIDEGQDFGIAAIDDAGIIELLCTLVRENDGTFYMFYDKRQFVQGSSMPAFINDADCKLSLYVNCRNTKSIATCSLRALGNEGESEVLEGIEAGGAPQFYSSSFVEQQEQFIDVQIESLRERGLKDIVILTCRTERTTIFSHCLMGADRKTWKKTRVPVFSCRRFKGLEADAVILVDVDSNLWNEPRHKYDPGPGLIFYTGASRAKYELRIVCNMNETECQDVLRALGATGTRKPVSKLAKQLNAVNVSAGR